MNAMLTINKSKSAWGDEAYFLYNQFKQQVSEDYYSVNSLLENELPNQAELFKVCNVVQNVETIYFYPKDWIIIFSKKDTLGTYDFVASFENGVYSFDDMQKPVGSSQRHFKDVESLVKYLEIRLK